MFHYAALLMLVSQMVGGIRYIVIRIVLTDAVLHFLLQVSDDFKNQKSFPLVFAVATLLLPIHNACRYIVITIRLQIVVVVVFALV